MNFNDDDSILYPENSQLEIPQLGNSISDFSTRNPSVGSGSSANTLLPGIQMGVPPLPPMGVPPLPPMGGHSNIGPPPKKAPSKNDANVQKLSSGGNTNKKGSGAPQTKAVSPGSISFCLFRFTYIWETNGRSYWAYLFNVDRNTASGLRWFRNTWVYFGVDLRRIDSFICYRCESNNNENLRDSSDSKLLKNTKKEYSHNGVRSVYTRVLHSIEVPEIKDDFIVNYLGEIDGNELTNKIPCKQIKITNYRIVLELTYPEKFNKQLIDKINSCATKSSMEASKHLNEFRDSKEFLTPLEVFDLSARKIEQSLRVFSNEFNNELKSLKLPRDLTKEIRYIILEEILEEPWRII